MLVSIPGIGKKLAERIIFELKEKVAAAGVAAGSSAAAPARRRARSWPRSRRSATRWARPARRRAWRSPTRRSGAGLEERVKAALRTLAPRLTRPLDRAARWSRALEHLYEMARILLDFAR